MINLIFHLFDNNKRYQLKIKDTFAYIYINMGATCSRFIKVAEDMCLSDNRSEPKISTEVVSSKGEVADTKRKGGIVLYSNQITSESVNPSDSISKLNMDDKIDIFKPFPDYNVSQ